MVSSRRLTPAYLFILVASLALPVSAETASPLTAEESAAALSFGYFQRIVDQDAVSPGRGAEQLRKEFQISNPAVYLANIRQALVEQRAVKAKSVSELCARKDQLQSNEAYATALRQMKAQLAAWNVR